MYPRGLAVRVLTRVLSDREPLDEVLNAISGEIPKSRGDERAWLQEVCSGTLRWKGRLELAIDSAALKKKPSGWLRRALLLGAYQLIGQERTSPGAVVSETVNEVKRKEGEAPARFANAVLRKVSEHAQVWRTLPLGPEASTQEAAAWGSLPEWLWTRLSAQHGRQWAETFASACLARPVIWARAKSPDWNPSSGPLADRASQGPVPYSWKLTEAGLITSVPGFAEGDFIIQDISSQFLVSEISGIVRKELGGSPNALDLCAAPGGKSVGLRWSGFNVTASDREERLPILKQTCDRTAPEIQVISEAAVPGLAVQDLVWVDAPCTGTGIIRRHPDVRWIRKESDLQSLMRTQEELLRKAWEKVRPGGFLAYSVCSVLKEEGPEALKRAGIDKTIQEWFLTPQSHPHGDGFWAALARKSG